MGGAEERSRTADTRIFSPLLYHLSYLGLKDIVGFPHPSVKQVYRKFIRVWLTAALSKMSTKLSHEKLVLFVGSR